MTALVTTLAASSRPFAWHTSPPSPAFPAVAYRYGGEHLSHLSNASLVFEPIQDPHAFSDTVTELENMLQIWQEQLTVRYSTSANGIRELPTLLLAHTEDFANRLRHGSSDGIDRATEEAARRALVQLHVTTRTCARRAQTHPAADAKTRAVWEHFDELVAHVYGHREPKTELPNRLLAVVEGATHLMYQYFGRGTTVHQPYEPDSLYFGGMGDGFREPVTPPQHFAPLGFTGM